MAEVERGQVFARFDMKMCLDNLELWFPHCLRQQEGKSHPSLDLFIMLTMNKRTPQIIKTINWGFSYYSSLKRWKSPAKVSRNAKIQWKLIATPAWATGNIYGMIIRVTEPRESSKQIMSIIQKNSIHFRLGSSWYWKNKDIIILDGNINRSPDRKVILRLNWSATNKW